MPELPEVETIRRSLAQVLPRKKILLAHLLYPPLISTPSLDLFKEQIRGKTIIGVRRRGKYLLLKLEGLLLAFHLRMTGSLLYGSKDTPLKKHTHLILSLGEDTQLCYVDPRKFGRIFLFKDKEMILPLKNLGQEPLSPSFNFPSFKDMINNRRGRIKSLLLDQGFLAGIGNIYSDEILFDAGLNPSRRADTLGDEELKRLFFSIQRILKKAISLRGTTISDYRDGLGLQGSFQHHLQVYGRKGEECKVCKTLLLVEKIGGRSSCFCPTCQQ